MFLDPFHSRSDDRVRVSAQQASRFAKEIADDFNPIHDEGSKRFCVPGDLLFSLVLANYGMSASMCFVFTGMVGDGAELVFEPSDSSSLAIGDAVGKTYLTVEREGAKTRDKATIEAMIRGYVAFSGRNFPHVLVPLMAEHGVMINPTRPLVVYERMSFELEHADFEHPTLEPSGTELAVAGKRGEALLHFDIMSAGERVGRGFKKLLLSGLRPYEAEAMEALSRTYLGWKESYRHAQV